MRPLLALCILAACTASKGDPLGDDSVGDESPFTSSLGMSSDTPATTTASAATDPDSDPTDPTLEPSEPTTKGLDLPPMGSGGDYLLAVSTIVDPTLPLQFYMTVDASDPTLWTFILQPLSLNNGQTDEPQLPVGDPLVFPDIPVIDGQFTLDLGEVTIDGAANPITGTDISGSFALDGRVLDPDFFCGYVRGMLTAPLQLSLDGSTFAATRVTGLDALPDAIPIDCDGATVSSR